MRLLTGGAMYKLVTTCLALVLAGCGSTRWYKDNTSDQEFYQDEYACTQEAQQPSSNAQVNAYGGTAQSGMSLNYQMYKSCMYARGYRETAAQSQSQAAMANDGSCEWFKDYYAKQRSERRHPHGTKLTSRAFAFECKNGKWDYLEDHDNQAEQLPRAEDIEI